MALDKLSANLLISNIIIIKNDPISKSNKLIKGYTGKKDYETIDNIIDQSYKFRDHLINIKGYFDNVYNKAKHEKVLLSIDKEITKMSINSNLIIILILIFYLDSEINCNNLLNKKKKRDDAVKVN